MKRIERAGLALVLTLIGLFGAAAPSLAQSQPPPTLAQSLLDQSWVNGLYKQLSGSTYVLIDQAPYVNPRNAGGVGVMLSSAAKRCGFSLTDTLTTATDHMVWLVPVSHPTKDDVFRKITALSKVLPPQWLRGREEQIADGVSDQLTAKGFSVYIAVNDHHDLSQRSVSIAFLDKSVLDESNRDAIVWYAIFAAITGAVSYDKPVDSNEFSYLIGGGSLGAVAGDNASRNGKLCRASLIIKAVCDSVTEGLPMAAVQANLVQVLDACQPESPLVKLVMYADAISQPPRAPH